MPQRLLSYLPQACIVGAAVSGCDTDSLVLNLPDGAAAPTGTAGAASDVSAPSRSDVMPPSADVTPDGDAMPDAGASNARTMTPAAVEEEIEPEWSDALRVCPPSPGYPVLGYGLTRQNHIDEFEGCERIDAALTIFPFEGADLRPLRSLREVRGRLTIGDGYTSYPHGFPSLEGLEGLRRVRGLTLSGIQARDLTVFRNLQRVDDPERSPFFDGSSLEIIQAENLIDLQGLENVRGIYSLRVEGSPALRSLQGVRLAPHPNDWGGASIADSPVVDFADIGSQAHLGFLWLRQTPLQSLDPFRSLRSVGRLVIAQNPDLVQAGALAQLESLQRLEVTGNPQLATVPDLPVVDTLVSVQLRSNPVLVHAPGFPRVTALSSLSVVGNPLLERLDAFAALTQLGDGTISNNDHLLGVDFTSLVEVTGTLTVRDNPELDASSLSTVEGRIKRSGNRDRVPTLLSPCPWVDDDECDEPPYSDLCAPGTDPVCLLED